jgi:hypothetical protein|tara:strand:- start:1991 stop:2755 length:765 start_codon:yes stop_codon:yes gene_type:complete
MGFFIRLIYKIIKMIISITTSALLNSRPSAIGSNSISIDYGDGYTFTLADFTTDTSPVYADPEDDDLSYVYIKTLPNAGELHLNGTAVLIGDEIASGDISTSNFVYIADSLYNEGTSVSFTFDIADQGSSTVSGLDDGVMTIVIDSEVNNPPSSISDNSLTAEYSDSITFTSANFQVGYVDPEGDAAYSIKVLSLPMSGELRLDGIAVSVNQEILFTIIDSSYFVYVPDTSVLTAVDYSFDFAVSDEGSKDFTE